MSIKDKVRRASKIFTSDSKENITEVKPELEATATEVEPATEITPVEAVANPVETAEPVAVEETTAVVAEPAEAVPVAETEAVEPSKDITDEPAATDAVAKEAEPAVPAADAAAADTVEPAATPANVSKEPKKTDFFKKLLAKFNRPANVAAK